MLYVDQDMNKKLGTPSHAHQLKFLKYPQNEDFVYTVYFDRFELSHFC